MHMRNLFILFFILIVSGCSKPGQTVIEGVIPGFQETEQYMYLVAAEQTNQRPKDSVRIADSTFTFRVPATGEVKLLWLKPTLRLRYQPMLVVLESGRVRVVVAEKSKVEGTRLNDALQAWKERKERNDAASAFIMQGLEKTSHEDSVRWLHQAKQLSKQFHTYNFEFLKQHAKDSLGHFLFRQIGFSLNQQQQNQLCVWMQP